MESKKQITGILQKTNQRMTEIDVDMTTLRLYHINTISDMEVCS